MAYFKTDQVAVEQMVKDEAISIVAGDSKLQQYNDLLADVRHDQKYHSIRALVQPDNPEVRDIARVLVKAADFITAAQEFVNSFTTYRAEVGDYWATPAETLAAQAGDCDDKGILLCSILRNYIPPDRVYCAFGLWRIGKVTTGHLWVITEGNGGEDRIIEATAGPEKPSRGKYILHGIFNDKYCFSTEIGLKEFDLKPEKTAEVVVRR